MHASRTAGRIGISRAAWRSSGNIDSGKRELRIVYYISGHGFGHTSRSVELIKAILAARPETRIIIKTSTPAWMFETIPGRTVEVISLETDTGITQHDSVSMDERDSLRRAFEFYKDFDATAEREAEYLRQIGASIVLGDIPPLAHAAAARAGVPSVAISNFTWDWIYEAYDSFRTHAADVIETIRRAYAHATLALRLPMHGGFAPMAAVTVDIPFIARRATLDRADTRRRLGVPDDRPFVLASF